MYNLVERAMLLSHLLFHQKNLKRCINILFDNGYPLHLVFNIFNRKIKTFNNNTNPTNNNTNKENKKSYFIIPYNNNILELGYRCLNKLNKIIKAQKDKNSNPFNNNIIYKIKCNWAILKEHINIKLDPSKHTVVSENIINLKHTFDCENIKILDIENNFHKRLISEMVHIKKHGINYNTDSELLDSAYFDILDELSNI
ncbi:hypothetical protein ACFW04_014303 [Cataglyphis niger]